MRRWGSGERKGEKDGLIIHLVDVVINVADTKLVIQHVENKEDGRKGFMARFVWRDEDDKACGEDGGIAYGESEVEWSMALVNGAAQVRDYYKGLADAES